MSKEEEKDDFYVGYLDKAPKSISKLNKKFVWALVAAIILITALLSVGQRGFVNSTFELGNISELSGKVYLTPKPFLKVKTGKDIFGNPTYKDVLLIGYGKNGATTALELMSTQLNNETIDSYEVTLAGTLVYYDGITLFELTKGVKSLLNHKKITRTSEWPSNTPKRIGNIEVEGQIVDSKCYFGVMKPGHSKPHRSCAIRCISGGIPPFMAAKNTDGILEYYILLGENGEPINNEVLDYVADPVKITGSSLKAGEWNLLYINPEIDIERIKL